ncbi:hypothetical protein S40293_10317 [Stachybotrys chartarum IBT 40293]|nr:hypothetical protein S40293_10317 [Stachybotrys chartarum IBT 40293]
MTRSKADREVDIQNALDEISVRVPVRETAHTHAIAESTLRGRLQGRLEASMAKVPAQRLSQIQEKSLINWIITEEAAGRAPGRAQVAAMAEGVLRESDDFEPVGHNWVTRFLGRHPEIKMRISRSLAAERSLASTREAIESHIARLDKMVTNKHLLPQNTYNMDETGVSEGETYAGKVCGTSLTKQATVTESDCREWATIIECGNALGKLLTPARKAAITKGNLEAGFATTGIYPLCLERAVEAVLSSDQPPLQDVIPPTPRKRKADDPEVWNSPTNSQSQARQSKKKVRYDPNEGFDDVEQIEEARLVAEQRRRAREKHNEPDFAVSIEAKGSILQ